MTEEKKPEEKAREKIDQWFSDAGWKVVNRDEYEANLTAAAIREGKMNNGLEADYLLFIEGRAIGVLEAKHVNIDITKQEVSDQVEKYANNVPPYYHAYKKPLPFLYKANGKDLYFRDYRDKNSKYEKIPTIHSPHELVKKLGIEDPFAGLPTLSPKGLRDCQYSAITELEKSFRAGKRRALIVMATGAGKTFTACLATFRFLRFTQMRRVLFLVDRNNLGRQAENEFGQFRMTDSGDPFNTIYNVERLKSNNDISGSHVVISTIQRLFSFIKGSEVKDNDEFDDDDRNISSNMIDMGGNLKLPPSYFDLIIVDESHRSIYGKWQKVLQYFSSARFIGLTATPIPETEAFFDNNRVINYTLEQSIIDGVNVDSRIYRIKTEVTENGGAILAGDKTIRETRYTGKTEEVTYDKNVNYSKQELNRSIINPAQIKLILQTYRDRVYNELYPEREDDTNYLPKTLIFALNERHANNIVKIAKEVFQKEDDPDFVQKITYSVDDSNALINKFNYEKSFRIAVTCTLVATGTDVPPLEVVIFMRDVDSEPLYVQMKGRGVRTIIPSKLKNVTPNAWSKDNFVLIDAVGVTEHEKSITNIPLNSNSSYTLKDILEKITYGEILDEYIKRIAGTLANLNRKVREDQKEKFRQLSNFTLIELSQKFYNALEGNNLPEYVENEENKERKELVAPIANHAVVRQYILELNAGCVETIQGGEDALIYAGFSVEEAKSTQEAFEKFCFENADRLEALKIIYNKTGEPIYHNMLKELQSNLIMENNRFTISRLWNTYSITENAKVRERRGKELEALTNLIQLVRFAYKQIAYLESFMHDTSRYFNLWLGQLQRNFTPQQREVMYYIYEYIASNGASTIDDIKADDEGKAAQLIMSFNSIENANNNLLSLYNFVFTRQSA